MYYVSLFQEFQGDSNDFCFQSLNPNILLSFFRFSVAGERSGGPGGPGTRVAIDSDPSKHFGHGFFYKCREFQEEEKRLLASKASI